MVISINANILNVYNQSFQGNKESCKITPETVAETPDSTVSSKAITAMVQGGLNAEINPINETKERQRLIASLKPQVHKETYPKLETISVANLRKLNELIQLECTNRAGEKGKFFPDYWAKEKLNTILDNKYDIGAVIDCAKMTYVDENGIAKNIYKLSDVMEFLKEGIDISSPEFKLLSTIMRDDANAVNTSSLYGDIFDNEPIDMEFWSKAANSRHRAPRFKSIDIIQILKNKVDVNSERFKELLNAKMVTDTGEIRPLLGGFEIAYYYSSKAPVANIEKLSSVMWYSGVDVFGMFDTSYAHMEKAASVSDIDSLVELAKLRDYGSPKAPSVYNPSVLMRFIEGNADFKIALEITKQKLKEANGLQLPDCMQYSILGQTKKFGEREKELKELLNSVQDEELKGIFSRFYASDRLKNLDVVLCAVDAYNNLKNNYTTLKLSDNRNPYFRNYMKYCADNGIDIRKNANVKQRYSDFLEDQRVGQLVDFCKNNDNELSQYMYENIYLKERTLPPEVKEICSEINKEYGTKVFLPFEFDSESEEIVEYIQKELAAWKDASNGKAKYPLVIDLLKAKKDYIDPRSACGKAVCAGFCRENEIAISGYEEVKYALRHELAHLNDEKRLFAFPKDWYDLNGGLKECIQDKFRVEFSKGGINWGHIDYAFNNPKEFIAVATEGNISRYSQSFIHQIKEFGIPNWIVNLKKFIR